MRVGLVCPYDWSAPGGVQAHVRDLAVALQRLGHEVSVLAPCDDDIELPPYVVSAGRAVTLSYNGSKAKVAFGPVTTRRVRRWLRNGRFDVLHVHEPLSPSVSILSCWSARGPVVATWHSSMQRSRALAAMYPLAQTALEKVSARIAVSEAARQTLVEHMGGDAVLIPNGVDCSAFGGVDPLPGWPGEGHALFFIGRIDEPRKGLPVLLEALPAIAARHPGVRLLVAGPGDVEEFRESLSPDLASRVEFLGLVTEDVKARAFVSAEVYVAPNTGGESFGIVLLEAMASGTPVLASDIEAFRRVVDGGRAGATFVNEDPADLARVAIALLDDAEERARLSREGLRRAREFDWETVAKRVVEVYDAVTVTGERVTEDFRGQLVGRLSRPDRDDRGE
ncbi:MAG: glycosyltransferase family 4 protein [Actinomycetales bacterium]|nr:glycosyltransferase family 4 protein [Actinomycetales bacterium]